MKIAVYIHRDLHVHSDLCDGRSCAIAPVEEEQHHNFTNEYCPLLLVHERHL